MDLVDPILGFQGARAISLREERGDLGREGGGEKQRSAWERENPILDGFDPILEFQGERVDSLREKRGDLRIGWGGGVVTRERGAQGRGVDS